MAEKLAGAPIDLNGTRYIIPPLTLGQFLSVEDDLNRLMPGAENPARGGERFRVMARIVTAAFSRNYPDVSVDEMMEMLDLASAERAFDAALAVSGLVAAGEPTPAKETVSTSPASSTDSPLPTDGPTATSAS